MEWSMLTGTVLRYDRVAAYGWIVADDETLPDFFVIPKFMDADKHHRFLVPGWRVDFEPFDIDGKPQAHNVRVISRRIARQVGEKAAL
jgi:cold shock CspA family protein